MKDLRKLKIAIIGLGYVGLPLALAFSKKFKVLGFDIDNERVKSLKLGKDHNNEFGKKDIVNKNLTFSKFENHLKEQDIFIITAPTPLQKNNLPNLNPLKSATVTVAKNMKKNSIVIIESTVYPGTTEEICVPLIEKNSKFILNKTFYCGYSPERINPGDKIRTITKIKKVVSASNKKTLAIISGLYKEVINAGIYQARSIKVAEAAKVIENTQRDLNIAFINELSFLFSKLKIDTQEVLQAASTKWNFLNFQPGLVGGHCVSVDPYYLTYKSRKAGYNPKIILSGRKVNNSVAKFISNQSIKLMEKKKINIQNSKILIAGFTFKNDCSDFRNTKVLDIYKHLKKKVRLVDIYDPLVSKNEILKKHKIRLIDKLKAKFYDGIIIAVNHKIFKNKGIYLFKKSTKKKSFIYDVKNIFGKNKSDLRL